MCATRSPSPHSLTLSHTDSKIEMGLAGHRIVPSHQTEPDKWHVVQCRSDPSHPPPLSKTIVHIFSPAPSSFPSRSRAVSLSLCSLVLPPFISNHLYPFMYIWTKCCPSQLNMLFLDRLWIFPISFPSYMDYESWYYVCVVRNNRVFLNDNSFDFIANLANI